MGAAEGDDAAVYRLDDERALVFTTDFFTPIVDDPGDWGRIAAANALSDVYAMGGRPLLALNLTAWPGETLPLSILADVLRGGASVAAAAGCLVVGGHTIDDPEPKYGMAVVGLASPARLFTIDAARPGDTLVLTKAIGTGVVATAHKRGAASDADVLAAAVASMTTLNAAASEAALAAGVVAATDVTGFSLLGPPAPDAARERLRRGRGGRAVPLLPGALELTVGRLRLRRDQEQHGLPGALDDVRARGARVGGGAAAGRADVRRPAAGDVVPGRAGGRARPSRRAIAAVIGRVTDGTAGHIEVRP